MLNAGHGSWCFYACALAPHKIFSEVDAVTPILQLGLVDCNMKVMDTGNTDYIQ